LTDCQPGAYPWGKRDDRQWLKSCPQIPIQITCRSDRSPVFVPDEPISEMTPSFGAYFEAAEGNVLSESPLSVVDDPVVFFAHEGWSG
jgi:hypothetical protein